MPASSYLLPTNNHGTRWIKYVISGAYHVEDAPDPGAAGAPEADGGVDDLDGDERAGDGADARAAEQAALRGQADQAAGDRSQEQPSCATHVNV